LIAGRATPKQFEVPAMAGPGIFKEASPKSVLTIRGPNVLLPGFMAYQQIDAVHRAKRLAPTKGDGFDLVNVIAELTEAREGRIEDLPPNLQNRFLLTLGSLYPATEARAPFDYQNANISREPAIGSDIEKHMAADPSIGL